MNRGRGIVLALVALLLALPAWAGTLVDNGGGPGHGPGETCRPTAYGNE